jgi:hypothetical protein
MKLPSVSEMRAAALRLNQAYEDEPDAPQRDTFLKVSVYLRLRAIDTRDRREAKRAGVTLRYYRKYLIPADQMLADRMSLF